MQYSLSSRFRGALLGQATGATECDVEQLLFPVIRSLVRLGKFDASDWCNAFDQHTRHTPEQAVIASLPLALFYHDNELNLRKNLQLALESSQRNAPAIRDGVLAVGYAIAQCLTEKLNATTLIPKTVAFLGQSHTQIPQQLLRVQAMLEQQAGLERVQVELNQFEQSSASIPIAFYCFLSTLEDLHLSVRRAAQNSYQPQKTSAITGALSGAYNSASGIPASLRVMLSRHHLKSVTEMIELSNLLLVVWSGLYDQAPYPNELTPVAAIAAPQVIRPGS